MNVYGWKLTTHITRIPQYRHTELYHEMILGMILNEAKNIHSMGKTAASVPGSQ
jgi:REP element-mobilizing transposase RayT